MRFCQTGALSEVTVKLSAGVRRRAGVDISELPVCLDSTLALRSSKRVQGRGSHRQKECP